MAVLNRLTGGPFTSRPKEEAVAQSYIDSMAIKTPTQDQLTINLSGGTQQKVVLAKWMATNPKVLIFDEPTRGIDVGAKVEIYKLINEFAREGVAVLMISSELPEILGMSDRILVIHEGRIAGFLERGEATQERILELATGQELPAALAALAKQVDKVINRRKQKQATGRRDSCRAEHRSERTMSQSATYPQASRKRGRPLWRRLVSDTGPLLVLIALTAILWFLAPAFRSPTSIMLIGLEAAAIGVVAAGQTFVILTGGIDLSVEAMVSFAGVVAAILIAGTNVAGGQLGNGWPSWAAILMALTRRRLDWGTPGAHHHGAQHQSLYRHARFSQHAAGHFAGGDAWGRHQHPERWAA